MIDGDYCRQRESYDLQYLTVADSESLKAEAREIERLICRQEIEHTPADGKSSAIRSVLRILDCREQIPYREAWEAQHIIFDAMTSYAGKMHKTPAPQRQEIDCETIILLEHRPVLTLGVHGNMANLLINEDQLNTRGIECIRIERGGDITYHGPGQLVMYPLISLDKHMSGVRRYVEMLEETAIRTLNEYGITGQRNPDAPGVWIECGTGRDRKICALGVKCSHGMTMHGLALNVNTDLSGFGLINPCGFADKGVTSMAREIGQELPMDDVKHKLVDIFLKVLETV